MTYDEAIKTLFSHTGSFQKIGRAGYHPGLETMESFDTFLGSPHRSYKSVHIAGTNGKGSTAHFLAAAFAASGYRTGLYTSPHLTDFRERIKVIERDGYSMIDEASVVTFAEKTGDFIRKDTPSYFEITTAMAFDWFRTMKVDMAVIETGLGGRLDSTNIITPILSIITSIGLDHKDILGETVQEIAKEKGGIIKEGVPVVVGCVGDDVRDILTGIADSGHSTFIYAPEKSTTAAKGNPILSDILKLSPDKMDIKADIQSLNLQTVVSSLSVISGTLGFSITGTVPEAIMTAAKRTGLRGRWEFLSMSPDIICDIGHNENALRHTMKQLSEHHRKKGGRLIMVFGMAADKDIAGIRHLLPQDADYVFTNAQGSRAMPAVQLQQTITSGWKEGRKDIFIPSVEEAVRYAQAHSSENDVIFIGGSSYVVAEALHIFSGC